MLENDVVVVETDAAIRGRILELADTTASVAEIAEWLGVDPGYVASIVNPQRDCEVPSNKPGYLANKLIKLAAELEDGWRRPSASGPEWCRKAAAMLVEYSAELRRLRSMEWATVQSMKRNPPQKGFETAGGRILAKEDPKTMAIKICDSIDGTRDLWQFKSGAVVLAMPDRPVKGAEFLMRVDYGTTVQDVEWNLS